MRTHIIIPIFVIITLIITGCSSFAPPPPTPAPVTIRFAFQDNAAKYQPLADQFHQLHPNITIVLKAQGGYNFDEFFSTQYQTVNAIRLNVAFTNPDLLNNLLPIDDILASDKNISVDNFFPGTLEALQYKGSQIGIPAGIDPYVVYYEPKRFEISGVTPPSSDWTLDDFLVAATKVNNQDPDLRDQGKFVYGFCTTPGGNDPLMIVYLFGGKLFDQLPDPTRPTLNDPNNVEALRWYASLKTEYKIMPQEDYGDQFYRAIGNSQCGFWQFWYDNMNFDLNGIFGSVMLPLPSYKSHFGLAIVDGYFIVKNSPNPQETWQWISFLVGQQSASGTEIPPLQSQIASEDFAKRVSPDRLAIARGLSRDTVILGISTLQSTTMEQITQLFSEAVDKVMAGTADAQSALDDAQRQAEALFK